MSIIIDVAERIATARDRPEGGKHRLVCGNKYTVEFVFDSEWDAEAIKTARLTYNKNGKSEYDEFVFEGTSCEVEIAGGITEVNVGVYAGDLKTSTPARFECLKSILCGGGVHEEPPEDVYNQLLSLIKNGNGGTNGYSERITDVTLKADAWIGETSPYSQVVTVNTVTPNSKVILDLNTEQAEIFSQKKVTFTVENTNGVVTFKVTGDKPKNDHTFQVTIKEVVRV